MTKSKERSGGLDIKTIILAAVAVLAVVFLFLYMSARKSNSKLKADLKKNKTSLSSLKVSEAEYKDSVATLEDLKLKLEQEVKDLEAVRDRFQAQRDSIARLLAYSTQTAAGSKNKIAQLKAMLEETQSKLDSVSRRYTDLMEGSGSSIAELQAQIESLTQERNKLVKENQDLKTEIIKVTGNADNRTALFATNIKATPGRIRRSKFQDQARARRTEIVETAFSLSRAPQSSENLVIKLFDAANKEIPLKPTYRNELNSASNPTKQKIRLEPESYKFVRGPYSVRMYMTNLEKGIEENEIGVAEFSLK